MTTLRAERIGATLLAASLAACGGATAPVAPVGSPATPGDAAAPAAPEAPSGADASATAARPLDEADEGASVEVAPGRPLVVSLKSNPTTGYDWAVVAAPEALGDPESSFEAPDGGAEGASGRRRFTWTPSRALPPGEHALVLGYRRAFEGDKPPIKTYRLKLHPAP